MAWTTPRTWVAGESVTASMLNTHVRDNFLSFGGRWSEFTPSWGASGTNPTIGNGRLLGRYAKAGRTVAMSFELNIGSTTGVGTGTYRFGYPFATRSGFTASKDALLGWMYGENVATTAYSFFPRYFSTTQFELVYDAASGGNLSNIVSQTLPFTWATGDYIVGYLIYESAA